MEELMETWKDEKEREAAYADLFANVISSRKRFEELATSVIERGSGSRWTVCRLPAAYSGKDAKTPMQAVRNAIELDWDGGYTWLVWDRERCIGYRVAPNSFIYEALEKTIEEGVEICLAEMSAEEFMENKKKVQDGKEA